MHGIHPDTCTHHIYMDSNIKPVSQPQRRMDPMLQDIIREELKKLLRVNFIYPISDSQWVSPLVIVPKKNGKWCICVDYRQLNKETLKDYFPLPFIDQVLDTLAWKSSFSFLDGFSGYNQITIASEDQDKTTFTCPWGAYAYNVFTFGLCNAPATFQRVVLAIFADLVHNCIEVYMDDFSVYRNSFEHALENLERVLKICIEANLPLSNEKFFMMLNKGIVLGHYVSSQGIKVDLAKIQIIIDFPIPQNQREERSFLGYASYYRRVTRWLLLLQEFNITVLDRPSKENQVADFLSRLQNPGEVFLVEDSFPDENLFAISIVNPWYADLANYLSTGRTPPHFTAKEKKRLVKQSAIYSWLNGDLFYTGYDMIIRRCVRNDEVTDILKYCHDEPCGGHFVAKWTSFKVLTLGYYWPSIFKDAKKYVKSCDSCQRMGMPTATDEMPLQPQVHLEPFEKWALDFIGPINPTSNAKKYILVCTDYVTKWVEAKALVRATEHTVVNFLFEEIFVRYGIPREIMTDQGTQFTSKLVKDITDKYQIKHRRSTPYHPQANGKVESTNKTLEGIITKIVAMNRKNWEEKLKDAL
eukprot:PITA_13313